jgi:hypothetical protein
VFVDRVTKYCNDVAPPTIAILFLFQVTLKHSGSLFMYAGHLGGAYAKNSFGNVYVIIISSCFMVNIFYG